MGMLWKTLGSMISEHPQVAPFVKIIKVPGRYLWVQSISNSTMKKIFTFLFITILSFQGFSQSASKTDDIRRLLELTGSGKLGVQVARSLIDNYRKNYPKVDSTFWTEFSNEINPDELINLTIPIYEKYFTGDEIRELIQFYQSTTGKKIITVMPTLMQEAMSVGQSWGQTIGDRILRRLKEKGFTQSM
jgi:hypothetical protein